MREGATRSSIVYIVDEAFGICKTESEAAKRFSRASRGFGTADTVVAPVVYFHAKG